MNNINFFLIRHAESTANANGKNEIGQDPDTALTDKGEEQAKKLGTKLSKLDIPDKEYLFIRSSSYKRAFDTAKIALKTAEWYEWETEIKITDALVEYNPGDFKGMKRDELYADHEVVEKMDKMNMWFPFPNGETLRQTQRRAISYIENNIIYNKDILALAEIRDVNVVVFSHGMTIRTILKSILGFDSGMVWKLRIDNASISSLTFNDKGWFINSINDIGHLI